MKRCCTRWNDRQKAGKRILCLLMACLLLTGCQGTRKEEEKNSIRIGISLYRGDDTFINNIRNELEEQAKEYERENGIKVTLDIQDAKGSQNTQNNQVERFISLGCDVLCINPVDRMDASVIIDKAMTAGVPVVFFNREPVAEDLQQWDRLYYVGSDAKESGTLEGLLVDMARRSGCEEIGQFAQIFALAKRNGGNMAQIIRNSAGQIGGRIELRQEIRMLLGGKKMELTIMKIMPFGILLYIDVGNPGYFDFLYHNFIGIAVMTGCLSLYLGAYLLGEHIMKGIMAEMA